MPEPSRAVPAEDIEDRDPGLARERTDLAWTRTAVSFLALGTGMLRTNAIAGALVISAGVTVWLLGHLSALSANRTRRAERRRIVRLITVATTVTAIIALILAVLSPAGGHH
ncbi:DUF202 domain-containing protein [Dactylosporangium sp. NBC_01737]|uniref:DUF202 domain-containing protein n=1 Tax=Dactylosporangium sp. NBC_01737 TaxID=2975959 RepID=UPI002E0DB213|nr:DUF202 domain-containing protein [Dactylosporangium sp. NBC_01737]